MRSSVDIGILASITLVLCRRPFLQPHASVLQNPWNLQTSLGNLDNNRVLRYSASVHENRICEFTTCIVCEKKAKIIYKKLR
jgi:hypothetical protein